MAVAVSYDRKAILVTWEPGDHKGDVQLFFTNPGDLSDISNTDARANDGEGVAPSPTTSRARSTWRSRTRTGTSSTRGQSRSSDRGRLDRGRGHRLAADHPARRSHPRSLRWSSWGGS